MSVPIDVKRLIWRSEDAVRGELNLPPLPEYQNGSWPPVSEDPMLRDGMKVRNNGAVILNLDHVNLLSTLLRHPGVTSWASVQPDLVPALSAVVDEMFDVVMQRALDQQNPMGPPGHRLLERAMREAVYADPETRDHLLTRTGLTGLLGTDHTPVRVADLAAAEEIAGQMARITGFSSRQWRGRLAGLGIDAPAELAWEVMRAHHPDLAERVTEDLRQAPRNALSRAMNLRDPQGTREVTPEDLRWAGQPILTMFARDLDARLGDPAEIGRQAARRSIIDVENRMQDLAVAKGSQTRETAEQEKARRVLKAAVQECKESTGLNHLRALRWRAKARARCTFLNAQPRPDWTVGTSRLTDTTAVAHQGDIRTADDRREMGL